VARAHVQAFHSGRSGEKYLLGGYCVTFLELVHTTGELLGRKVPRKATPAWLLKAVARAYALAARITGREPDLTPESAAMITRHLSCDSGRAQRELHYRFTDVRILLQLSIDWMRGAGLLRTPAVKP